MLADIGYFFVSSAEIYVVFGRIICFSLIWDYVGFEFNPQSTRWYQTDWELVSFLWGALLVLNPCICSYIYENCKVDDLIRLRTRWYSACHTF